MASVERLYLKVALMMMLTMMTMMIASVVIMTKTATTMILMQVMLPVTLLILAAIFAFNLDLEKRIQAKVEILLLIPQARFDS